MPMRPIQNVLASLFAAGLAAATAASFSTPATASTTTTGCFSMKAMNAGSYFQTRWNMNAPSLPLGSWEIRAPYPKFLSSVTVFPAPEHVLKRLTMQWRADSKPIAGATSATLNRPARWLGKTLSVSLSANVDGACDETWTQNWIRMEPLPVHPQYDGTNVRYPVGTSVYDGVLSVTTGDWSSGSVTYHGLFPCLNRDCSGTMTGTGADMIPVPHAVFRFYVRNKLRHTSRFAISPGDQPGYMNAQWRLPKPAPALRSITIQITAFGAGLQTWRGSIPATRH